MPTYTIHDLPAEDRPRERLQEVGVDNLSIQELLTLIIERGQKGRNALTIAQNLLAHFGNLAKIKEASTEELQEIKGIGFATACKLKAAFKLGEKALAEHKRYGQKIENPEDVYKLLKNDLASKKKEHFLVLCLDSGNYLGNLIKIEKVSVGSLNASVVHPREVFKEAIEAGAASVILAHNHPSGDPEPSDEDHQITDRLIRSGTLLDISVLDHIIVTRDKFFSFYESGLLQEYEQI